MKVFVIDRTPDGTGGCLATLSLSVMPNVGDELLIVDENGERREYVVRGRRFVARKQVTQVRLRSGDWKDTVKDRPVRAALFVVSAAAFKRELDQVKSEGA